MRLIQIGFDETIFPLAPTLELKSNPPLPLWEMVGVRGSQIYASLFPQALPPNFPHAFHHHAGEFFGYPSRAGWASGAIYCADESYDKSWW